MKDRAPQAHAPPSLSFAASFEYSWSWSRFDKMLRARDVPGQARRDREAWDSFDWQATLAEETESLDSWEDDDPVLSDYSDTWSEDD